ncbi:uncharacterized protein YehS (DUF1456 family) [Natronobacillus azotifigens]|uniref:DUF1456 family protein n=1 Tax=Natronobacillus azotifigens TaxID=472978 RepID=A0A9J6R8U6_9BACI|nr:DUF1456 family protein [Natronobacillus azotifigens]MCZ0702045.1 DUF1456 family protein [Natronobacillus azotifigens]
MNNNDIITRLRYALDLKDTDMTDIFRLGGFEVDLDDVRNMLTKQNNETETNTYTENVYVNQCENIELEAFFNGLIIYKRGRQDNQTQETPKNELNDRNVNNIMLKKVKIALALTSEDILEVLSKANVTISKSELSAVLRKEGHRNYKDCGDRYARNFLKGLAIAYRG